MVIFVWNCNFFFIYGPIWPTVPRLRIAGQLLKARIATFTAHCALSEKQICNRKNNIVPFWWRSSGISSVIRRSRMSWMRRIGCWWATITWTRRWRVSVSWIFPRWFLHSSCRRIIHIAMLPGHWRSRICHFSNLSADTTNHCKPKGKRKWENYCQKALQKMSGKRLTNYLPPILSTHRANLLTTVLNSKLSESDIFLKCVVCRACSFLSLFQRGGKY